MYYYRVNNTEINCILVSVQALDHTMLLAYHCSAIDEIEAQEADYVIFYSADSQEKKSMYCINHPAYFACLPENLWCIDTVQMDQIAESLREIPHWLIKQAKEGHVSGITALERIPDVSVMQVSRKEKKRVHIIALGDVGGTMLIGLTLLGGDIIDTIGIYDFNRALCQRWEHEINQIAYPWQYDRLPRVEIIDQDALFDCDVFVFCASKSIPAVGSAVADVRMAQLEANTEIIAQYGKQARESNFRGLFAVVSDPVDMLCQRVYAASNCDETGAWDGKGLYPEQVQGYGLGVMNSRAAYYAKQDPLFAAFLTEGRAYGPHGSTLVIADSIEHYNHAASLELTKKTVEANLEVRELGFKPYIAPALSSAAISILLTLRGEWHYSANYLGGIYMGCKNRTASYGVELEHLPLPQALLERIETAQTELKSYQV